MAFADNKTKIVATVGPACNTKEGLRALILAGVDVFRLNFSHGTHDGHLNVIRLVRELNAEMGTHIALLQDLQGPKIRVEEVENNGVELVPGNRLVITTEQVIGTALKVSTSYKALVNDVRIDDSILIDDGKIELRVIEKGLSDITCVIIYGGLLKSRKGINLPQTNVSAPSLTEKDEADLQFGLEHDVDWVALSFVRTAHDMRQIKAIIEEKGKKTRVIAKIEKPQAVLNIDEIIAETDGIMVARGDLGVELPMEDVPNIQRMLIAKSNAAAKPVIVATQMLESMIENPRPTRAEANDVATAVTSGTDAVMLSAETASGAYPSLSVSAMSRIIGAAEAGTDEIFNRNYDLSKKSPFYDTDSVISSACILARDTDSKAVCALTSSGYSGIRASHHRPNAPIYIFTRRPHLLTQLGLCWGVKTIYYERNHPTDETVEEIKNLLKDQFGLLKGDHFILIASIPLNERGRSNMIKLTTVN
jgi:pyruvate kinase